MDGHALSEAPDVATSIWRYNISWWRALDRERLEFFDPFRIAAVIAFRASRHHPPSLQSWFALLEYYGGLLNKANVANQEQMSRYLWEEGQKGWDAWYNTMYGWEGETIAEFASRQANVMEGVANFSEQIDKASEYFGFHLHRPEYKLVHETAAFQLYQVLPLQPGVTVRNDLKPMLLVSPYMLGSHILAFLPYDNKSYAHAFANAGIPTYVRIVKDIWETEAVQTMTPEEDCIQTHELCEIMVQRHGQKVTLNGTCQGGYICLMNLLSGTYGDVCDTLITNVTPVDGTYSAALCGVPAMQFDFMLSRLPNGNYVANGYLLSLGMRLVAIEQETPLIQVLNQARIYEKGGLNPGRSTAALFRWLRKERAHLPPAIAEMSSISFQQPIDDNGALPVKLFGKPLHIGDLAKLGIRWYQNYALKDNLVTPACATAGNRFLDGTGVLESVPFPGGHVAILTSPYSERSPVDGRFKGKDGQVYRGPVLFQIETSAQQAMSKPLVAVS